MREQTGLSQRKFAMLLGIPLRTVRCWELEQRHPPAYVLDFIERILVSEGYLGNNNDDDALLLLDLTRCATRYVAGTKCPDEFVNEKGMEFSKKFWDYYHRHTKNAIVQ